MEYLGSVEDNKFDTWKLLLDSKHILCEEPLTFLSENTSELVKQAEIKEDEHPEVNFFADSITINVDIRLHQGVARVNRVPNRLCERLVRVESGMSEKRWKEFTSLLGEQLTAFSLPDRKRVRSCWDLSEVWLDFYFAGTICILRSVYPSHSQQPASTEHAFKSCLGRARTMAKHGFFWALQNCFCCTETYRKVSYNHVSLS